MRSPLMLVVAAAGCSFHVAGIAVPHGGRDLSSGPGDLAGAFDMAGGHGVLLSHLPSHYLVDGKCELAPKATIDTGTPLTIDGAPAPAGCVFQTDIEGTLEVAVLAVAKLSVSDSVTVTGPRPLAIVAADGIEIDGTLDAGAHGTTPGPGGGAAGQGSDAGQGGTHAGQYDDSGGGGGGALTMGAGGGTASFNGATATGGLGGPRSSTDLTVSLPGGASGGVMSAEACNAGVPLGGSGAGGGSIQLSARNGVRIRGNVNAGGGGGRGGCVNMQPDQGSGAGGGAGGAIWIEAPEVIVTGGLWSNGGGGGGGAEGLIGVTGTAGGDGSDGTMTMVPAAGGASPGMYAGGGGTGGTGTGTGVATGNAPGAPSGGPSGMTANGGGGGGSAGLIMIRYRGTATLGSNVSPAATLDGSVP